MKAHETVGMTQEEYTALHLVWSTPGDGCRYWWVINELSQEPKENLQLLNRQRALAVVQRLINEKKLTRFSESSMLKLTDEGEDQLRRLSGLKPEPRFIPEEERQGTHRPYIDSPGLDWGFSSPYHFVQF